MVNETQVKTKEEQIKQIIVETKELTEEIQKLIETKQPKKIIAYFALNLYIKSIKENTKEYDEQFDKDMYNFFNDTFKVQAVKKE
jgi:hypothetical protein